VRSILIVAASALALAGCASTVVLRNPETGEFARCGSGPSLASEACTSRKAKRATAARPGRT
jgi:uncharacterized protein YceK